MSKNLIFEGLKRGLEVVEKAAAGDLMMNHRQVNVITQGRMVLNQVNHYLVFGTVVVGGEINLVGYRCTIQIQGSQPQRAARLDWLVCQGKLVSAWPPIGRCAGQAHLADRLAIQ